MTDQPKYNKYTNHPDRWNSPMPQVPTSISLNSPRPTRATPPSQVHSFDNQPPRESYRLEPVPPADPGFYVVTHSTTAAEFFGSLFEEMPLTAYRKFSALNPHLGATVKAGSLVVLSDPNNTSCTYQEAQLMQAAQQVKAALDPLTPEEADFMFRHGAEIASFTGQTSTWLGISAVLMEKHLTKLRDTLQAMDQTHPSRNTEPAQWSE